MDVGGAGLNLRRRNTLNPKVHLKSGQFRGPGGTPVTCAVVTMRVIRPTMRFYAQTALLFLLCLGATPAASGQAQEQEKRGSSNSAYRVTRQTSDRQQKPVEPRPLTLGEGLAILGAALDSRHHRADFRSDCSHFVHSLYERAGFPYEYASSSDLYVGIDRFVRVANPQPGDLAVWGGHVGIVINPVQHSFFSALRSGPGVDSYDAPYWKRRGRPRFYRYIKPVPNDALSTSIRTASLQPAVLGNPQPHDAGDPISDGSEEALSDSGSSPVLAQNQPEHTETAHEVVVNSVRPKPDQVSAAFLQACTGSQESLRGRDLFFNSAQALVVFDHFEVKKVHISGHQGWAEVQVDQLVSRTGSKAELHKRSERQRWPLSRRANKSWELTPPRNTIYLPQHMAERILAHELAQLTEDSSGPASRTQDKAELARLLDVLLDK